MVNYQVNSKEFDAKIKECLTQIGDLRPAFIGIAREFYKANKAIFALKGPGKYTDFSGPKIKATWRTPGLPERRTRNGDKTAYQYEKFKKYGFEYPLLKAKGRLESSITDQGSADSVLEITKNTIVMGTRVPYAGFHQTGTKRMPMRQFLFVDPSTTAWANDKIFSRRNAAWIKALENYVTRTMNKHFGKPGEGKFE